MITELVEIFSALELQSLLPRARRTGVFEIDLSISPAPGSYLSAAKRVGSALTIALSTQRNDCQNSQCSFFQSRIFVFDLRLILTGNLHAMQASKRGYDLAAMYLPPKEILSLEVTDRGGESWSEDTMGGCGPWKGGVGDKDAKKPYGIFLDPSLALFEKVDGVLSTRRPVDTFRTRGWRAFSRSSLPHKVSV